MIIKAGMVEDQFNDLVSKIDAKHETIGIKRKELAERLTKLYDDIYCETNQGLYTFGMYKGLLNCNQTNTDEEFAYFNQGQISFKRFLIHSVFVNTLCCLRRITDKTNSNNTQSITRLKTKVEREIRDQIPDNSEVADWFDALEQKHAVISHEMKPLLTYIDKRISHFDRNWESKMKTSKIRDIERIYNLINEFNNTFRRFYEPNYWQRTIFISNGETEASRFIRLFHSSERLDNLRMEILELLIPIETGAPNDDLKREILKLFRTYAILW